MSQELIVHAVHRGDMRVTGSARNHTIEMDYPARPDSAGMTPLELLLASLAGCAVNSMAVLLKRASQPFAGIEVTAKATRREEHPTVLTDIDLAFRITGAADSKSVETALKIAETQICPVLAMLKDSTRIRTSFTLAAEKAAGS